MADDRGTPAFPPFDTEAPEMVQEEQQYRKQRQQYKLAKAEMQKRGLLQPEDEPGMMRQAIYGALDIDEMGNWLSNGILWAQSTFSGSSLFDYLTMNEEERKVKGQLEWQRSLAASMNDEKKVKQKTDEIKLVASRGRDRFLEEQFPDIHDTEYERTGVATVGRVAGSILFDPATYLMAPIASAKAMFTYGAGMSAADTAAYNLHQKGEIDMAEVGLMSLAGGTFAVGIQKFGKGLSKVLKKDAQDDILGAVEELDKLGPGARKDPLLAAIREDMVAAKVPDEILAKFDFEDPQKFIGAFDDDPEIGKTLDAITNGKFSKMKQTERLWENKEVLDSWERVERARDNAWLKADEAASAGKMNVTRYRETLDLVNDSMNAPKPTKDVMKDIDAVIEADSQRMIHERHRLNREGSPMYQAFVDEAERNAARVNASQKTTAEAHQGISNLKSAHQAGGIQMSLMAQMGTVGAGGVGGYAIGGEEGAIAGVALGAGSIAAAYKISKLRSLPKEMGGKMSMEEKFSSVMQEAISPEARLRVSGAAGKKLAYKLQRARDNVDLDMGEIMHKLDPMFKNMDDTARRNFVRAKQGIEKATTPEIQKAVNMVTKEFQQIVKKARASGIISEEDAIKMIRNKNYWTRSYDEAFLSSKTGRDLWVKTFTEKGWDLESLQRTVGVILHENPDEVKNIMKSIRFAKGKYYMHRDLALQLLEKRGVTRQMDRAKHFRARKIHVDDETILEPFMQKDPHAVLLEYFHDTLKQIHMAKQFGGNRVKAVKGKDGKWVDKVDWHVDGKALDLMDEIQLHDNRAGEFAREIFHTMAGDYDGRSKVLQDRLKMSPFWKSFQDKASAIETLKLTLAQIPNATQAMINGSTYIAGQANPFSAFAMSVRGVVRAMGKEGREFATRTGAAMETNLMEVIGESMANHRIFNGVNLGPGEFFNNPTTFLRNTGFLSIEKAQRTMAANMGYTYGIDLISKYGKMIEKGALKKGASKRLQKNFKKTQEALKELIGDEEEMLLWTKRGLPLDDATQDAILRRAGLRFSNMVNFTTTPLHMPHLLQSPHAAIFRKFKSFAFNQGRFVKDRVIKPALRGNFGPLVMYAGAVGAPIGMGADELLRTIKGDDKDLTLTERYLRGLGQIGGFGIVQNIMSGFTATYSGQTVSTIAPIAGTMWRATQDILSVEKEFTDHGARAAADRLAPATGMAASRFIGNFPTKKAMTDYLKEMMAEKRKHYHEMHGKTPHTGKAEIKTGKRYGNGRTKKRYGGRTGTKRY